YDTSSRRKPGLIHRRDAFMGDTRTGTSMGPGLRRNEMLGYEATAGVWSNSKESVMQKLTPFLWFDKEAEEAMNFYTSIFKNSKKREITRYCEAGPGAKGSVMTASFELEGLEFTALNGGPHFKFTEAVSFSVAC